LEKVATHTMLTFAAMNLKKLATWLWKAKKPMAFYFKFLQRLTKRSWQLSHSFLSTV
ncbi:IS5/IS1182 family transposase, partial [Enterococcus hirae]